MYPVSPEFREAIRRPHVAVSKAEVWREEERVLALDVLDGQVEVDGRRSVRRTCSVRLVSQRPELLTVYETPSYGQLAALFANYSALAVAAPTYAAAAFVGGESQVLVDTGIVPDDAFDALAPFGNELRLWRGIMVNKFVHLNYAALVSYTYNSLATQWPTYGAVQQAGANADVEELVPLGVFEIEEVRIVDGKGGISIEVTGSDRSTLISKNSWTDVYTIASGTNAGTAVQTLLENRYDEVQSRFTATSWTTPQVVFGTDAGGDPWADARNLAEATGNDLYFDGEGVAIFEPVPSYEETTPVATYIEDEEAMILDLTRSLSNANTFNGVIVTGEGTEAGGTIRADVWDDDTSSPTYYLGVFGKRPYFYSSPLILTQTQAVNAGYAFLADLSGATENVEWNQIVDPSLDPGDVISVQNTGTKVSRILVLDRVTIPLAANATMSATARTVRSLQE